MIKLVIVEQSEILRMGLKATLEDDEDIQVLAEYDTIRNLLPHAKDLNANLVLASLNWPDVGDFELCQKMRSISPDTKLLALAQKQVDEEMFAALMSGASGYLPKSVTSDELLRGVRIAAAGGVYFNSGATRRVIDKLMRMSEGFRPARLEGVSERDLKMLSFVAQGYTNAEISQTFNLSNSTVKNVITRLKDKLKVNSRVGLATFAVQNGFLQFYNAG